MDLSQKNDLVCFFSYLNNQTKKLRSAVYSLLLEDGKENLDETQIYLLKKLSKDLSSLQKWEPVNQKIKNYLKNK